MIGGKWAGSGLRYLKKTGGALTGALTVPDGTAAAPGIRLTSEVHGFYRYDANALGVAVNGAYVGRLSASAHYGADFRATSATLGFQATDGGGFRWSTRGRITAPADNKFRLAGYDDSYGLIASLWGDGSVVLRNKSDTANAYVQAGSLEAFDAFFLSGGYLEATERADPDAPGADTCRVYARDNGSGKTQLCVRFPTGAVQVLATEP